ncbi:hypothetical protein PTR23_11190 [Serratia nevei]|uniref:hypothetical protein n=1 Tax=Serratia TaxID=613 RepID=UPI000B184BEA|nr:hypothetical protein [Serratia marcescens]BEN40748.1 hypothetical protein SMKC049_25400 [Serratia marcescens]
MRKKKKIVREGICKLTLKKGKFVESHILPKSLTILSRTGEKTIQVELKRPLKKRFQGWYDNQLCIAEGEYILSQIDDKAIRVLRENFLIWSGWPADIMELNTPDIIMAANNNELKYGLRVIKSLDWKPVKLFMLSLLWRSAASEREEMDSVIIPINFLEKLRIAILNYNSLSANEFPIRLYQISDRGVAHNRTPIIDEDIIDFGSPIGIKKYTVCRLYLDGLIAYITLDPDENYLENAQAIILGGNDETIVFLHTYENSRTFENLREVIEQHQ